MTDYWLNKMVFELQGPDGKDLWTNHRSETIDRYPISADVRDALMKDDIGTLIPLMNPYLMRFYLLVSGFGDAESIEVLSRYQTEEQKELMNG